MSQTPATRSLAVVLREALGSGPGVRLLVGADAGKAAYLLAAAGRLVNLGNVGGYSDLVIEGETVPQVPRLVGASIVRGAGSVAFPGASPVSLYNDAPHDLGVRPGAAFVTWEAGGTALGNMSPRVDERTTTTVRIRMLSSISPPAGATANFSWMAIA